MDEGRVARKAADIEIAARALFEATKTSVVDLADIEWDNMPVSETGLFNEDEYPMKNQWFYRREVSTAVEALWRAGRLSVEQWGEPDLEESKFVVGSVIDARCMCHACETRTSEVYWMVGRCYNCGTQNILVMYRKGDQAEAQGCPLCGVTKWHGVHTSRAALPSEVPPRLEEELKAKRGRGPDE